MSRKTENVINLRFKSMEDLDEKCKLKYLSISSIKEGISRLASTRKKIESVKLQSIEAYYIYTHHYFQILKNLDRYPDFDKKKYPIEYNYSIKLLKEFAEVSSKIPELYKEKHKEINNDKRDANENNHVIQTDLNKDLQNGNAVPSIQKEKDHVMTVKEFYHLISDKSLKDSFLILDVRSPEDFEKSKLKPAINIINVPFKQGLSASKLKSSIDGNSKPLWDKRVNFDKIIILDWNSTRSKQHKELKGLIDAITKYDPSNVYKCKMPFIIDGGYEEIVHNYPMVTTEPKINSIIYSDSSSDSLGTLAYPDIDTHLEKPKEIPIPPIQPKPPQPSVTFDRLLKPKPPVPQPSVELTYCHDKNDSFPIIPESSSISEEEMEIPSKEKEKIDVYSFDLNEMRKTKPHFQPSPTPIVFKSSSPERNLSKTTLPPAYKDVSSDYETNYASLKGDGSNSSLGSKGLHKTSSSPNISTLDDNEPITPAFSRANKPIQKSPAYGERADSTYGSYTAQGLTGLKNFANNCYMNSIIQCLSNTQPLVAALIGTAKDSLDICSNPKSRTKGKIATEVKQAFNHIWRGGVRVYSITDLKEQMGNIKDIFKGAAHQDSNEFLVILLEYLHEDLKMPPELGTLAGAREETGEKAWGEFKLRNTSIIQKLFYGQQKSTVCCCDCKYSSVTFEQFFNLFVPLPSSSENISLMECIKMYMVGEKISGWKCPRCKQERAATKKFDITILPRILIIALKRFTQDDDSWLHKKENIVSYPLYNLDMSPFVVPESEQRFHKYNLYAMSIHSGTLKSGHYRAICKNHQTNKWYMFDDQSIEPLQQSCVENNAQVYILFYKAVKDD